VGHADGCRMPLPYMDKHGTRRIRTCVTKSKKADATLYIRSWYIDDTKMFQMRNVKAGRR